MLFRQLNQNPVALANRFLPEHRGASAAWIIEESLNRTRNEIAVCSIR